MSIFNKFGTNTVADTKQVTIEKIIGQSDNTPYWVNPVLSVNHYLKYVYQDVEPDPHVIGNTTSPFDGPYPGTRAQTLTTTLDLGSLNADFNDTREIRLVSMSMKGDLNFANESISDLLIGEATVIDTATGILDNITDYQVLLPKNLSNINLSPISLDPTELTYIKMNEGNVEVKCTFGTNISDEDPITLLLTFEYDIVGNIFNEDASNDPDFIPQLNNKDTLNVENAQNNADFLNYRSAQPFVVEVPRLRVANFNYNWVAPLISEPISVNDWVKRFYPNSINPTRIFWNNYQVIKDTAGVFASETVNQLSTLFPGQGYVLIKKSPGGASYNLKMHEFFGLETPKEYTSAMNNLNPPFILSNRHNIIAYPKKNLERNKYPKTIDNTNAHNRNEGYITYEVYKAMFGPNNPHPHFNRYEDPNHPLYLLPYEETLNTINGGFYPNRFGSSYDRTRFICEYILYKYIQTIKSVSGAFWSQAFNQIEYFEEGKGYMLFYYGTLPEWSSISGGYHYPGRNTGFTIHNRVINPLTTNVSLLDKQNFLNL